MLEKNGKSIRLTADMLMEDACRLARLHEWGEEGFRVPLGQLIAYFREKYGADKKMNLRFQNAIRALLVNRLFIRDNFESHPEILRVPLHRPLFIVGLSRTGSTLLHRAIARDLSCRVLLYWEALHPFIGRNVGLNHEEKSKKLAELKIKEMYLRMPDYFHIHEIKATAPEECNVLMRHTFCSMSFASEWHLPRYAQWLVNQDTTGSYRYYRKLLQLLLWHKPGNFPVLKCPSHLLNLDAILNVFPDANFVWLHRDPISAIPSYLNLLSVFWGNGLSKSFVDFICHYSIRSLEMGMRVEKKIGPGQFLNVGYNELVNDPIAVILSIYNYFKYSLAPGVETDLRKWLKENPRHKHGVHTYGLEKFGLTHADIKNRFSRYYDEYGHFL
ncbi:MAG: hypothetical protein GTO45_33515 [Candidatus Aminicenantes bacterium]|nr:hypothetical protein [Candidatus Aminicenantes bacterium]NIM79305.1 hypothetical protein [Candidatus Aminicenantes bacterium]NIN23052.1 hypothetical protein [Candidatus Aminicenantes bacterium]NIN46779.1 hypothetical protein [Candidatus Aminicenantes bacterium]NIN89701.1 hypothetical protein [Candidatus Aminicenantes bacterium]